MRVALIFALLVFLASDTNIAGAQEENVGLASIRQHPAFAIPDGTIVHKDIAYISDGHTRQKLDLYLPPGATGKSPLLVNIHGGAFKSLSKNFPFPTVALTNGLVMASVNYRLSQHAVFPAQVEDCKAAIRWLRKHADEYRIDPERIGVFGGSAGGYLAAMVGATDRTDGFDVGENLDVSSRVQAVIDFYGPSNFLVIDDRRPPDSNNCLDDPKSFVAQLFGGLVAGRPERFARANLLKYVTKDDPPFLIVHGTDDKEIPYYQSTILEESLRKANVPVTFHTVEGGGHDETTFMAPGVVALSRKFIDKHLKK